ncbi:lipopolysaccharide transport periplasmic protein LptA [Ectopseudomonas mendocina]|uniref:Lipopolysaccharide export system protein LptA n=1 Tax=Ectopseudomonas mendocina TaxID=300 RepID=A0ABZ2RI50_ECTME
MRLVNTLSAILSLGAAFNCATALALPSDSEQPIRIQADSGELDDKKGVAVYRGDVIITQGSMKVTGDTVTVTRNAQGEVEVFTSVGKPAYYEQKPSADKQIVKAYGLTIQYFMSNDRVVLIDQAKVVQEGNTFEGEKIVYDTKRQIVNAGRATGTNVSAPRPRIDMVIQPKNKPAGQQAQ